MGRVSWIWKTDFTFTAGSSPYTTTAGADARQSIIDDDNWTFNDGSQISGASVTLSGGGRYALGR